MQPRAGTLEQVPYRQLRHALVPKMEDLIPDPNGLERGFMAMRREAWTSLRDFPVATHSFLVS